MTMQEKLLAFFCQLTIGMTWKKYNDFDNELPLWQKEILDKRMGLLSQNPSEITPLDIFIKEMEAEANEQA